MGRLMGFEPMHIGTTIRGLNRLTTGAIVFAKSSISNKDYKARGLSNFLKPLIIFYSSFYFSSLFFGTYILFLELLELILDL